jgi:hypothetical protein
VVLGEDEVKQLLLLMDTDKNGKISKEEFMTMEAELERLDKGLVLLSWPAEGSAKLVLDERGFRGIKKPRASNPVLRRNSNAEPCSWFEPDFVTTLVKPPE